MCVGILDIKWSIQQAENLIAKPEYMSTKETFTEAEATAVIQQYNDEMNVAAKKYNLLISRANKAMKNSVEELQKIADELALIEKHRLDVHSIQNYLPNNQSKDLVQFPLQEVVKANLVRESAAEHIQSLALSKKPRCLNEHSSIKFIPKANGNDRKASTKNTLCCRI